MAERRMFSKRVVRSARFLKMPSSSRDLYWQLGIEADDDGIVEAFNVMRLIGASEDDLRVLVAKNFVQILNDDLVAYITDWNENNKIRADRKIDSIYKDLLLQLNPDVKLVEPRERADRKRIGTSHGQPMDRIGEVSIVEESIGKEKLVKESVIEEKKNLYFDNDDLESIFKEFLEVRKKIRAVNSDRAIKTLLNKLNKYTDDVKYQMIENSIVNSWKDVYELKPQNNNYRKQTYVREEIVPDWFNKDIEKKPISEEDKKELDDLLSEFTKPEEDLTKKREELQAKLKEKYGKKANQ